MSEVQMWLTESEVEFILAARKIDAERKARFEKQQTCQHDWSYRGEWRGESSYECHKCGETKWE